MAARRKTKATTKPADAPVKISDLQLAEIGPSPDAKARGNPFAVAKPPPGVVPQDVQIAMDTADQQLAWAANAITSQIAEGVAFLGYAYLAELAQRPEYRALSEIIATEMTREWIELQAAGEDDDKSDKIKQIEKELVRMNVRGAFRDCAMGDGFFGRAHLFLDFGTEDAEELKTNIGNGTSKGLNNAKIAKGSFLRVKPVEAVWCYPTNYNSSNPLRPDWYRPSMWYAQGTQVSASRLLLFVGREVPDLLKPAYSFGGLSLTQMAKPYVDNWLKTRQAVADLTVSFSTMILHTDLAAILQGGSGDLVKRIELFNRTRSNRGLMVVQKEREELTNVTTPLGTLDVLQAQAQEHICSVTRIPAVKYTGLSPTGLNASSEGEMRSFYDWINAFQEHLFRHNLQTVINFIQVSLFGEIDPGITFKFKPLWSLDEKASAEKRKTEADTDTALIDAGVISPEESRRRVANDPATPYGALDADKVPERPDQGEGGDLGADPEAAPAGHEAGTKPEPAAKSEPVAKPT